MILSTLSISSHCFDLSFFKRLHNNGDVFKRGYSLYRHFTRSFLKLGIVWLRPHHSQHSCSFSFFFLDLFFHNLASLGIILACRYHFSRPWEPQPWFGVLAGIIRTFKSECRRNWLQLVHLNWFEVGMNIVVIYNNLTFFLSF